MTGRFELGWEEWLALPELGLPAIKAKVDTGAKTSALHAHDIEFFEGDDGAAMVRFVIQPSPDRPRLKRVCEALIGWCQSNANQSPASNGARALIQREVRAIRRGRRFSSI